MHSLNPNGAYRASVDYPLKAAGILADHPNMDTKMDTKRVVTDYRKSLASHRKNGWFKFLGPVTQQG
jgi:hypothetical protein